jgi:Flp pilus assembly protein TadD
MMTNGKQNLARVMRSTALCSLGFMLIFPSKTLAFNPNEGAEPAPKKIIRRALPSTAPLLAPQPRLNFSLMPRSEPVASEPVATAPVTPTPEPLVRLAPVTISAAVAPPIAYPPVDEATRMRAAQEMQAMAPASTLVAPPIADARSMQPSYIARAPAVVFTPPTSITAPPSIASAHIAPPNDNAPRFTPIEQPNNPPPENAFSTTTLAPLPGTTTTLEPATAAPLSDTTKRILSGIPSHLNAPAKAPKGKLAIKRANPEVQDLAGAISKVESYDTVGLSIKVSRRSGLDTNYELNHAYAALMGGDSSQAIDVYKNILSVEPTNQDALFGVAATYHRSGDVERARPYYAQLLKINPNHREGLNNFLALMSDESPQEALAELDRLEERNPNFSPIPAQQALVLNKLGYTEQARQRLMRAIELAPENLTYKYNLAVILDRNGNHADAAALYRMLIDASLHGAPIPSSVDKLQRRLNFIASASPSNMPIPLGS